MILVVVINKILKQQSGITFMAMLVVIAIIVIIAIISVPTYLSSSKAFQLAAARQSLEAAFNAQSSFYYAEGYFAGFKGLGELSSISLVNLTFSTRASDNNIGVGIWDNGQTLVINKQIGERYLALKFQNGIKYYAFTEHDLPQFEEDWKQSFTDLEM